MATPYEEAVKELLAEGYMPDQSKLSVSVEPLGPMPSLDPRAQAEAELLQDGYVPAANGGNVSSGWTKRAPGQSVSGPLSSFASGMSFGFADELAGAADAIPYLLAGLPSWDFSKAGEKYKQTTSVIRDAQKTFAKEHPFGNVGAEIAGILATAPVAAGKAAPTVLKWLAGSPAAKTSGIVRRLGRVSGQGAAGGALFGAGTGEDIEQRLKGLGFGGVTGALLAPVLGAGVEGSRALGNFVKYNMLGMADDAAVDAAAKALITPEQREAARAITSGVDPNYRQALVEDQNKRLDKLEGMLSPRGEGVARNKQQAGEVIKDILETGEAEIAEKVSVLYNTADQLAGTKNKVVQTPIMQQVQRARKKMSIDDARSLPGSLEDIYQKLSSTDEGRIRSFTFPELTKMYKDVNELTTSKTRRFAGALRGAIKDLLKLGAEKGKWSKEAFDTWDEALNLYKYQKKTYDTQAVGAVLKKNKFQDEIKYPSQIPQALTSTEGAILHASEAARGQAARMKGILKRLEMEDIEKKGIAGLSDWLSGRGEKVRTLFSSEHWNYLNTLADQFTRHQRKIKTAQEVAPSVGKLLDKILGGESPNLGGFITRGGTTTVGAALPIGIVGPLVGLGALEATGKALTARSINNRKALFMLLADKDVTKALTAPASETNLVKAFKAIDVALERLGPYTMPRVSVERLTSESKKKKTGSNEAMTETSMPKKPSNVSSLVDAVIKAESAGRANAVSPKGAQGLMQLMPATGKEMHQKLGLPGKYDPFDKEQNKAIGTAYLNEQLKRFGDVKLALAAYNGGPNYVKRLMQKYGNNYEDIEPYLWDETRNYVKKVTRYS